MRFGTAGGLGQGLVKVPAPSKRGPLAGWFSCFAFLGGVSELLACRASFPFLLAFSCNAERTVQSICQAIRACCVAYLAADFLYKAR